MAGFSDNSDIQHLFWNTGSGVKSLRRDGEAILSSRFERTLRGGQKEAVVFESSDDIALVHQYRRLQGDIFSLAWGGHQENKEPLSAGHNIIARIGRFCVGGCRLDYKRPLASDFLPMEKEDFVLAGIFPDLPIASSLCAEISCLAILPEYQNDSVIMGLMRQVLRYGLRDEVRFIFSVSPVAIARDCREAAAMLGAEWKICKDVAAPDYDEFEGTKMAVSMLDLSLLHRGNAHSDGEEKYFSALA